MKPEKPAEAGPGVRRYAFNVCFINVRVLQLYRENMDIRKISAFRGRQISFCLKRGNYDDQGIF